jgi:uncharacterized protein (DUF488 family)
MKKPVGKTRSARAKKSEKPLLTIGYEQATLGAVLDALECASADVVVDTRLTYSAGAAASRARLPSTLATRAVIISELAA